jgi:general secretion pathway protein D
MNTSSASSRTTAPTPSWWWGSENETERVRALSMMLDRKIPRSKEKVHVRYLEYAKAENIATILTELQSGVKADPEKGKLPTLAGDDIKITSDSETNSLIVYCQKDDYLAISEIIDDLDIPRPMVYIESLIMEVDAGKQLEIGTDWQAIGKTSIDGKDTAFGGGFQGGMRAAATWVTLPATAPFPLALPWASLPKKSRSPG